jgi:Uncharacterized conserved protein
MPFAARVGDMHVCPAFNGPQPHVGGPVLPPGTPVVMIEGRAAACVGDLCACAGPPDAIAKGSPTVSFGGRFAARVGDTTAHGGTITVGALTVMIGP